MLTWVVAWCFSKRKDFSADNFMPCLFMTGILDAVIILGSISLLS